VRLSRLVFLEGGKHRKEEKKSFRSSSLKLERRGYHIFILPNYSCQ
jgi:hypothetical protein